MKPTSTIKLAKKKHKASGFTLVEVVTATFVALVGLAGAMSIGIWQFQATRFNMASAEAAAFGQEVLEELSQADYSSIATGSSVVSDYNMNWSVTPSNRWKKVTLNISWNTGKATHQITLNDLFPDDDVDGYIIAN